MNDDDEDRLSAPIRKAQVMTRRMAVMLQHLKSDPSAKAFIAKSGGARIGNTAYDKRVFYRLELAGYTRNGRITDMGLHELKMWQQMDNEEDAGYHG